MKLITSIAISAITIHSSTVLLRDWSRSLNSSRFSFTIPSPSETLRNRCCRSKFFISSLCSLSSCSSSHVSGGESKMYRFSVIRFLSKSVLPINFLRLYPEIASLPFFPTAGYGNWFLPAAYRFEPNNNPGLLIAIHSA